MVDNPLVSFLGSYAATAASDSLVDERVRLTVKQHGIRPIEANAPKLEAMKEALLGEDPVNVILTGTAGDGKTFHIRQLYLRELEGDEDEWGDSGGRVLETDLPSGRRLKIVKDLSEVKDSVKAEIVPAIADSLLGKDRDSVWLMAANDGQLLEFWREASQSVLLDEAKREQCRSIYRRLMDMLRLDQEADAEGAVNARVHNMSRTVSGEMFDGIVDGIVEHEGWSECGRCAAAETCPIRLNRALLRGRDSRFRKRLLDVMRISALNDNHVPIRYIFVLVSNILLGDAKNPDRPILTCATARRRANKRDYRHTNPYNNALGLNMRSREAERMPVFAILRSLGIGLETNNFVDRFLLDRSPAELAEALERIDPTYGDAIFRESRLNYLRGNFTNGAAGFDDEMAMQRRRLFFLVEDRDDALSPWKLTIYQHAGRYISFTEALADGDKSVEERFARQLIKGINRTLTGMMTEDGDQLWLARSIGRLDGGVGRITFSQQPVYKGPGSAKVIVERHSTTGRPQLRVTIPILSKSCPAAFDLRPLQFEYLMRVAEGSLPSSFSRQCQQELRHFALVSSAFINKVIGDDGTSVVQVLSLGRTGQIQSQSLDI